MVKNKEKYNSLIKKKNLILLMKNEGIKRASPDTLALFEAKLNDLARKIISAIKEEIDTNGRKTAKTEDIIRVFSREREIGHEI